MRLDPQQRWASPPPGGLRHRCGPRWQRRRPRPSWSARRSGRPGNRRSPAGPGSTLARPCPGAAGGPGKGPMAVDRPLPRAGHRAAAAPLGRLAALSESSESFPHRSRHRDACRRPPTRRLFHRPPSARLPPQSPRRRRRARRRRRRERAFRRGSSSTAPSRGCPRGRPAPVCRARRRAALSPRAISLSSAANAASPDTGRGGWP